MKQCLSLCLGLMLTSMRLYAQDYEDKVKIATPSPNNLSSTQSYDVDYYSGRPRIAFPLYKLESDDLAVSIGISYRASGVKLNDYASYLGLNWDLQAGGSVTRVVRGLPDESPKGYIGKNGVGALMNTGNHSDATRANNIANGDWDGEPDLFSLTTPYESISFVFDEQKNPVFAQPSLMDIKLVRANGPDDDINIYWTATDSKGNTYTFGNSSSSRETVDGPPAYVSTWYLNSVKSFNATDEITFLYLTGSDIATTRYLKTKVHFNNSCGNNPPDAIADANTSTVFKQPKYLYQIIGKQGKVIFNYAADRKDLEGGRRLVSMDVYAGGTDFLKQIKFRHDYIQDLELNKDLNRLALKDVYVIGNDGVSSIKLYEFKYFNNPAAKFPTRNNVTFDHWGYYNNNTAATPFPPQATKEPDLEKTKQFTLYEIEYGLGGKTTFTYELNSYLDQATQLDKSAGGLRIKSISETDNTGNTVVRNYEYKLANGKSSGQHFLKSFVYTKTTTLLIATCTLTGESFYSGVIFGTNDLSGNAVAYSRVKVINQDGGSEVYTFKNFSDQPDEHSIVNASLSTTYSIDNFRQFGYPTSYAHRRGLLENKTLYNAAGDKVSESIYEYTSLSPEVRKSRGVSLTLEFRFASVSRWYQAVYYHVVDNYMLTKATDVIYDMVNPALSMTSEKNFEYSTDGKYLRKTTQTTSDGSSYATKNYYPVHRSEISGLTAEDNTAYGNMQGLAVPIREEITTTKGNKDIVHHSYKSETNGGVTRVFPTKELRSKNGAAFRVEQTSTYNYTTGNLDLEIARDGIAKSYLHEQNGLIKAEIVNATPTEVFFEDFEQHPNATTGSAHTGNKYYATPPFQINFVRPNQRSYKLAYNRYVNNKWEYVLTDYSTDNLLLTGSSPIDNVRVFPVDASITSYNHQPLIGPSAKSLPNNNVAYYEYDEFQRMKVVRDRNRNVVNRYEYKTACDCPLPIAYASLQYSNYEIDDTREDYYSESAEVKIVLRDANYNPISMEGITVNVLYEVNTDGVVTSNIQSYTFSGSETSLGRIKSVEQYFGPNGNPFSLIYTFLYTAPGIGYLIQ